MFITLQNVEIRFATSSDMESCIAYDHIKDIDIIQRKVIKIQNFNTKLVEIMYIV